MRTFNSQPKFGLIWNYYFCYFQAKMSVSRSAKCKKTTTGSWICLSLWARVAGKLKSLSLIIDYNKPLHKSVQFWSLTVCMCCENYRFSQQHIYAGFDSRIELDKIKTHSNSWQQQQHSTPNEKNIRIPKNWNLFIALHFQTEREEIEYEHFFSVIV